MAFGADRTVKVNLKATVSDYIGKMTAAGKSTADFARKAQVNAQKNHQAFNQLSTGLGIAGAAIGAAVGLAVKSFADFDKQMSVVRAVSGATAGQMDLLRTAAIQAGQATKFSASDAAKAEGELAKVGISTADILGGALTGSLNLAAAGNLDLADAAQISGQAMKIFGLRGKDVGHIADVLASGANKSAADVSDLGQALQQGGLVAAQTGLTLEDTVGTLSAFADNALLGSDAGTSLKTMLQRLNPQSQQAADLMKKLGLSAYDSQGQFVGITAYAGKLQDALHDMAPEQRNAALQILFGSDAVRGANILYKLGAKGIADYTKSVNDQGAASRVAAIQMDNLSGDLEQLKGSIETALIQSGSGANTILRDMVQTVTGAVNAFGNLPQPLQAGALGLAAVGSAGLLAAGGILKMTVLAGDARKALDALNLSGKLSKAALGPIGLAFTAATIAVGIFAKSQLDAKAKADELRGSLDQQTGAITDNTRAMVAKGLQDKGTLERARGLGVDLKTVTDAALGNADAFKTLKDAQSQVDGTLTRLAAKHGNLTDAEYDQLVAAQAQSDSFRALIKDVGATNSVLNPQIEAQKEVAAAAGTATTATDAQAQSMDDVRSSAEDAKKALDDYVKGLIDAGLAVLDTRSAQRDLAEATDTARKAAEKATKAGLSQKKMFDLNTKAGRENQAALDDQADKANRLAQSIYDETGSESKMRASMVKSRAALITTAEKFGMSKKEAEKYADQVLRIPPAKHTTVTITTKQATTALQGVQTLLHGIRDKHVTLTVGTVRVGNTKVNAGQFADGGQVAGPGTGTSDSIPAYLSNGEYVVKAAAVARYGTHFLNSVNSMRFASGGLATRAMAGSSSSTNNATFNAYGNDSEQAMRKALREWEFRQVPR
jgi:TP901 family phage tail tape measure protein